MRPSACDQPSLSPTESPAGGHRPDDRPRHSPWHPDRDRGRWLAAAPSADARGPHIGHGLCDARRPNYAGSHGLLLDPVVRSTSCCWAWSLLTALIGEGEARTLHPDQVAASTPIDPDLIGEMIDAVIESRGRDQPLRHRLPGLGRAGHSSGGGEPGHQPRLQLTATPLFILRDKLLGILLILFSGRPDPGVGRRSAS